MSVLYNTVLSMLFKAYGFEINKYDVYEVKKYPGVLSIKKGKY